MFLYVTIVLDVTHHVPIPAVLCCFSVYFSNCSFGSTRINELSDLTTAEKLLGKYVSQV